MNVTAITRALGAAALSATLAFGLAACSNGGSDEQDTSAGQESSGLFSGLFGGSGDSNAVDGVAAVVNGAEISEQTIADYVQEFRENQSLTGEDDWGYWLADYSLTPEGVREQVIDFYVENELKEQAAVERDITVDDAAVDAQVETMKANYSDDQAWKNALTQAGTTEEQYRESVRMAMLESQLKSIISEEESVEVTDEDVLENVQLYANAFNGAKRSSHILFSADDEATAQEVLDKINAGELDFAEAAETYSQDAGSAVNGGDVGWDLLNTFVSEYTDGLAGLQEGEVSGLVTSQFGIHIIKCTELFTAPEDITSLEQVPSELVDYIRAMTQSANQSSAYDDWFETYKEEADITINPMPEGLPYWVDMTKYVDEDAEAEAADATAEQTVDVDGGTTTVTTEDGTTVTYDGATGEQTTTEGDTDAETTIGNLANDVEETPVDEGTEAEPEATTTN